jgi:hypothetical protein
MSAAATAFSRAFTVPELLAPIFRLLGILAIGIFTGSTILVLTCTCGRSRVAITTLSNVTAFFVITISSCGCEREPLSKQGQSSSMVLLRAFDQPCKTRHRCGS